MKISQEIEKDRILRLTKERNEIIVLEDGFRYYAPSGGGALSAANLRMIADILDEQNAEWEAHLGMYFDLQRVNNSNERETMGF